MLNESLYKSDKMDWGTPQYIFDYLNKEFNFTLDVCADSNNTKCKNFFSIENNGLSQNWDDNICWMNPPYGRDIKNWVEKAYRESRKNCTCVCLVPVRSDTKWWHDYVMKSFEIRLFNKRLSFAGANNKAPFPAAIIVFNKLSENPKLSVIKI